MPDIALGVSTMALSEHGKAQDTTLHSLPNMVSTVPQYPPGPCPSGRYSLTQLSHKRHVSKQKVEPPSEYPDLYDLSNQDTLVSSLPPQATYMGPDSYGQHRGPCNNINSCLPDTLSVHTQARLGQPSDSLHLDILGQRMDLDHTSSEISSVGGAFVSSGCSINDSDLTCGLGPSKGGAESFEEHSSVSDGIGDIRETSGGAGHHRNGSEETGIGRDHGLPNKPEYQYKKSAL